jgi:hypothetical protein
VDLPRDMRVLSAEALDLRAVGHSDLAESVYLAMETSALLHRLAPANRRGC